ncbi:arsenite efflux transporter metallochaperone ArsD [Enterococcus faecalis]|uniref:arsenite efflux transporter metallochaperone ArsD n=1 Tax=Enterococcus faecalis TaxID=1351 RepID=UPI0035CBE21E
MRSVVLFESEMCCGVKMTGAEINRRLLYLGPTLQKIQRASEFEVERYSLTIDPEAFIKNQLVNQLMDTKEMSVLPVTLVDGEIKKFGAYPSREEFTDYTGLTI